MKLVLFDIDGTILWSDGAGRRAMQCALTTAFGSSGSPDYRYDGKTDMQIVRDLMRMDGHHDEVIDSRMTSLLDEYLQRLRVELGAGTTHVHRFDGVVELLDALEARADRTVGLLTGNIEDGARQLKESLRPGDLVLLRGRRVDHLARIYHALIEDVTCWRNRCDLRIDCGDCPRLNAKTPRRAGRRGVLSVLRS